MGDAVFFFGLIRDASYCSTLMAYADVSYASCELAYAYMIEYSRQKAA